MCQWGNKCFHCVLDVPGTPSELRERLINKITLVLNSGSDEECAICLDSLRQPVITYCAHVYCRPCICEVIRSEKVRIISVSQRYPEDSCIGFLDSLFLSHRSRPDVLCVVLRSRPKSWWSILEKKKRLDQPLGTTGDQVPK